MFVEFDCQEFDSSIPMVVGYPGKTYNMVLGYPGKTLWYVSKGESPIGWTMTST